MDGKVRGSRSGEGDLWKDGGRGQDRTGEEKTELSALEREEKKKY